jgi:hypothetical protein
VLIMMRSFGILSAIPFNPAKAALTVLSFFRTALVSISPVRGSIGKGRVELLMLVVSHFLKFTSISALTWVIFSVFDSRYSLRGSKICFSIHEFFRPSKRYMSHFFDFRHTFISTWVKKVVFRHTFVMKSATEVNSAHTCNWQVFLDSCYILLRSSLDRQ